MAKNELTIRSSAAEFLIFEEQSHADGVEVIYQDGTLWMSQRMMGLLFDVESNTITYHLGEIYKSGELEQISTTRKIRVVQQEGSRNVNREIEHYNLDAIISVGYRVNSIKATQFRRWATQVLSQYTQKGYVIDHKGYIVFRSKRMDIRDYTKYISADTLMGPNSARILEELLKRYPLRLNEDSMVLDLGCGTGLTSLMIAKETRAKVYANDLWVRAEENEKRFEDWGVGEQISAVHEDANDLNFEKGQFDALFSIDSYHYFAAEEGFF